MESRLRQRFEQLEAQFAELANARVRLFTSLLMVGMSPLSIPES
jgi:hypothetical protein